MEAHLATISLAQGSYIVNDTTESTKSFDCLQVLEDTVFTSLKVGGVDKLSEYVSTPATAVKAGAIIRAKNADKFSGVQLTSGSVTLVL
jgi:hypothetical protein